MTHWSIGCQKLDSFFLFLSFLSSFSFLVFFHLADVQNVLALADERGEDHVHVVGHAKLEVLLIALRQGGQVDIGARQVHTLVAADRAA